MSKCYVTVKGEVINPRKRTTANGKTIQDFAIKVDTQDWKSKEWISQYINGTLIGGDIDLVTKTIYEFQGQFDVNHYTNKDGVEIKNIVITAFEVSEAIDGTAKPKPKKKSKKPADVGDDFEFEFEDENEVPF